ncbi:BRCA2-interacting transcriptional repressor EMSY [Pectinophora gossypiella]|uniref:BRCA2-interacting transcriptional repressor EMSY n=1 Tax=Pectinophora gossypiella TaxID=13191 RepID=UPI00214F5C7F|nr:BRCA2-interacting transcriptional repressor EMSY [Pectinophora gossypiella]
MWPMLLNMTRDECRRTLRRLELEAYSNMISVFRAQGALEDNRKKLLEELRAVLHISQDRHSAEARRVSNDEVLATIAEQLAGPNTGLAWISEGRRRVPLLPRGVAQTMYTEIADKAAEAAAAENKEIQKKLEAEKLVAPKTNEEELPEAEGETAEGAMPSNDTIDELLYPPVAMEDQTAKLWETELINRKRKIPEGGAIPDDTTTPVKNMRNIPVNTNQKHLNLSQIYSKFSQPATSKPSGQSKHSYNQVSKVSTSKSHHPPQTPQKHRSHKRNKNPAPIIVSKSQVKKPQEMSVSPSKYNPSSMQHDYSGPPNTFQASYAQAVLGGKTKQDYIDELKPKVVSPPGMMSEGGALQQLPPPATLPHELGVPEAAHDPASLQAQATSTPTHTISGKPCHLIIKNKGEITTDKKVQILQKPSDIKLLTNKQLVVAPSATQKALNSTGKLVATKVISSVPKQRGPHTPVLTDKMIVVSKPAADKGLSNSKIIITSSTVTAPTKTPVTMQSISPRTSEAFTPKGIPATDLKVSAKTVVLNPKSGQKMVVLPAKARTKSGSEGQIPLLPVHFKGISTSMKLVPVSSQSATQVVKSSSVTVVSKPSTVMNTITPKKIIGVEPIKTANLADIVPVKGMTPITTPKITNPIVRPVSKGNVIVVPKGATIGKALTFTKNGNDMSKIIMGKNVNQLLQATKTDQPDSSKCSGNVIVLELNNEQTGRTTTMSEILDSRVSGGRVEDVKKTQEITSETPVLFDNQMTEETCNANSLDSTTESISDIVPIEESGLPIMSKEEGQSNLSKDSETAKDSSSVTDWEMELDTVSGKEKDDDNKLNALHLDLGMSSDDDNDYMGHKAKSKHSSQESIQVTPSGESSVYGGGGGLALATRTLLSQLQDDGSSSNDSSFALKSKTEKLKEGEPRIDRSESDALTKAKEKLTEKVAKSHQRIDIYSTAIASSDINLDSFSYLDEGMMAGDDEFPDDKDKERRLLHEQLSRLLGADAAEPEPAAGAAEPATHSHPVSESLPLNK